MTNIAASVASQLLPQQWRLSTRLTVLLSLVFIPFFLVMAVTFWGTVEERRNAETANATSTARSFAAVVVSSTDEVESLSLAISSALGRQQRPLDQETVGPYLGRVLQENGWIRALFFTDPQGIVRVSQDAAGVGRSVASRPYIQALQGGRDKVWSNTLPGLDSGQATVAFGQQVMADDGTGLGFLVFAFYPESIAKRFPMDIQPDADVALIDEQGTILYSAKRPDLIGQRPAPDVQSELNAVLAGNVQQVQGRTLYPGDEPRSAGLVPVPSRGWVVVFSRTQSAIDTPLQRWFVAQAGAVALFMALSVLLAITVARRLTRPLSQLAASASAIARGVRPTAMPEQADAEVAQLAEAMETMSTAVQDRYDQLFSIYHLTDTINRSRTEQDLYGATLDSLVESIHVDRAAVIVRDAAGVTHVKAWYGLSEPYRKAVEGLQPWADGAAFSPVMVDDLQKAQGFEATRKLHEEEGVLSMALVPLLRQGQPMGKLALYNNGVHQFSMESIRLVQTIGRHLVIALEQIWAEESVRYQRALLESQTEASLDGILVRSTQDAVLYSNQRFKEMWDMPQEVIARGRYEDVLEFLADRVVDADTFKEHSIRIHDNPEERSQQELRLKDGRVLDRYSAPVKNSDGLSFGRVWYYRDITDRKRSEEGLQFLAKASIILSASLDPKETIQRLAELAVPQLGDWCIIDMMDNDDNKSLSRVAVVHRDPRKHELARSYRERSDPTGAIGAQRVLTTGKAEMFPIRIPQEASEQATMRRELGVRSLVRVPMKTQALGTFGVITLFISESDRHYDDADMALASEFANRASVAMENARLYRDLQQAIEAKDEFLGVISHELRTPITTIYGAGRLLRTRGDRLDAESKNSLLTDVEQEADHLAQLVDDLLLLARMELGKEHPKEPVSMPRIIDKVCTSWKRIRPHRDIRLDVDPAMAPVAGDQTYIEQTLRNYLSNADKYSPSTEPIDIRAVADDDEIKVTVLDRGPGVDPSEMEQIFERFYRSEVTAHKARGLGIGLTACKRLVEAQSGRVWARPREGGGLEVGFALPIYKEVTHGF